MLSVILFCFCVCALPVFLCSVFDKKFEEGLPLSFFGAVALIYCAGLIFNIQLGVYLWFTVCCLLYVAALIYIIKNKSLKAAFKNVFTLPFFLFLFLAALLAILNVGRMPVGWDEFSHWATTVKGMFNINDFAANPLSNDGFGSYPPAMSLLQYAIEVFERFMGGEFSEWKLYYVYQLFSFSLLLPFLKCANKKTVIPCFAALFIAAVTFTPALIESLYIDSFLGLLAAFLLAYTVLEDKRAINLITFSLGVFTLALTKDVGIYFAFAALIAYAIALYKHEKPINAPNKARFALFLLSPIFATLFAKLSWSFVIKFYETEIPFKDAIDLSYIIKIVTKQTDSPKNAVIPNYIHKFFVGQHLTLTSISTTYFLGILLIIFAVLFICRLNKSCENKIPSLFPISMVVIGTDVLYAASLPFIYISKFSDYEAPNLASHERYLSIIFSLSICYIVFCLVFLFFKNISLKKYLYIALVILILLAPSKAIRGFFTRTAIDESYNTIRARHTVFQALKTTVPPSETSDIGVISFFPNSFEIILTNYYLFENPVEFLAPPRDEGASAQKYNELLTDYAATLKGKYNYIMVLTLDDYFKENCAVLFENPNDMHEYTLYEVDESTGLLQLMQ